MSKKTTLSEIKTMLFFCYFLNSVNCFEKRERNSTGNSSHQVNRQTIYSCPDDWLLRISHCYYFSKTPQPYTLWSQSEKECEENGHRVLLNATLVSIHNEEENRFIVDTFVTTNTRFKAWIGLRRPNRYIQPYDRKFEWFDGSNMTFNFLRNESAITDENCGLLFHWAEPFNKYFWGADSCTQPSHEFHYQYVCKAYAFERETAGSIDSRTIAWIVVVSVVVLAALISVIVYLVRNERCRLRCGGNAEGRHLVNARSGAQVQDN